MSLSEREGKPVIRHIVLRTFVAEATAEQIAMVEQNTRRFVEVEGVLSVSVSTNRHRSARAEGLDHVTMIDIRDEEALHRLLDSDVRALAVEFASPLTQRSVIVDVEL